MKNQEIQVWKSALNQGGGIYEGGFRTNSTVLFYCNSTEQYGQSDKPPEDHSHVTIYRYTHTKKQDTETDTERYRDRETDIYTQTL